MVYNFKNHYTIVLSKQSSFRSFTLDNIFFEHLTNAKLESLVGKRSPRGAARDDRIEPLCAFAVAYPLPAYVPESLPYVDFSFQIAEFPPSFHAIQRMDEIGIADRAGFAFLGVLRQMPRLAGQGVWPRWNLSFPDFNYGIRLDFGGTDAHLFG